MNIHSVDNQGFTSNQKRYAGEYSSRRNPRYNIDNVINLSDEGVKELAYLKTVKPSEDKKHKNLTKAMLIAVPFAAGLASAILKPAQSSLLQKEIKGTAARLLNGAKSTAVWGGIFGLSAAIVEGRKSLEKKFPEFDKLTSQNPLLTFAGSVAAFAGVLALGFKAVPKALDIIGKYVDEKAVIKLENRLVKKSEKFNNNSVVKSLSNMAKSIKQNKYLAPLGGFAEMLISWSPVTLLFGGVLSAVHYRNTKDAEFVKNYSDIKEFQHKLAKARIRELSLQNDFLMQDAKNREDAKFLKRPLADLPQEVLEKINNVREERAQV